MPLIRGFKRETIRANINEMISTGHERDEAIAAAHRQAREDYRRRHPRGPLPWWIYQPPRARANPVNDLDAVAVNKGFKLYEQFTGRPADKSSVIRRPKLPDAL